MFDRTEKKLESYFQNKPQKGLDGQFHEIDTVTRISRHELDCLALLLEEADPQTSIESGMAYGFSTLTILDFMEEKGRGHHIAIDPGQIDYWHGIALYSANQLGFADRLTWINSVSDQVFSNMITERKRVQFVFLDGIQSFDGIIVDFFLSNKILDIGGVIVFNQLWMPGGRAAASFVSLNATNYRRLPTKSSQFFAFEKIAEESRPWDHFVSFDGSGRRDDEATKPGIFRRLFG